MGCEAPVSCGEKKTGVKSFKLQENAMLGWTGEES